MGKDRRNKKFKEREEWLDYSHDSEVKRAARKGIKRKRKAMEDKLTKEELREYQDKLDELNEDQLED
jgi:hypothetical protein